MTVDITAEEFNEKYDVGTPVFFWPGWRKNEAGKDIPAMVSKTSTPAWEMPGGQQVVTVEGRAGGMWLQHVEIIPDFIVEHLKTPEESQAAAMLGVLGLKLEDFIGSMHQLMKPYYQPPTTCDGKCAKVEDLEEQVDQTKMESAQRQAEIDRLREELQREQRASRTYQQTNVGYSEAMHGADAKIADLRRMLGTQHARLTVVEGEKNAAERDYRNIEAKFVEARQKLQDTEEQLAHSQHAAELAELEISQRQDEIERAYEMLDPNTEIDDRVKSLPALVEELIAENQRLDGGMRVWEEEALRLGKGWDGARTELSGLRMQIKAYESAPKDDA